MKNKNNIKNKNNCISYMRHSITGLITALILTVSATCAYGQSKATVKDKDIVGTWILRFIVIDNEGKAAPGPSFVRIKIYRSNGEYACAEVIKSTNGAMQVAPHEFGTYSYKAGVYTEMGRKGSLKITDHNTFVNRWKTSVETWKRIQLPTKLTNYIVDKCRMKEIPSDIINMINKHLFNK